MKKSTLLANYAIASALASMEQADMESRRFIGFDDVPKEPEPLLFEIRERSGFDNSLFAYNRDLPNYRKHKATCAKNRAKRKAKKKPKH